MAVRIAPLLLYGATVSLQASARQTPPSADTFALSATPKANYGAPPLLAVTNGATTLIQFNLSSLPANPIVSKATLRLYVDAVTESASFDVYEVNTLWAEGSLNFVSAPTPGLSVTGTSVASGQPVVIDSTGHLGSSPALSISGTGAGDSVNTTTGYQINGGTQFNDDANNDIMIGLRRATRPSPATDPSSLDWTLAPV